MTDPLLSKSEALAILEEHDCPFKELLTMHDVLYWCLRHENELPYSATQIMKAFFPHNPQNVRDSL